VNSGNWSKAERAAMTASGATLTFVRAAEEQSTGDRFVHPGYVRAQFHIPQALASIGWIKD
jgi:hypothetical protein